jgi:hypothetical protein
VFEIFRNALPKYCSLTNPSDKFEFEDPISLGPIYGACNFSKNSNEIYSYSFLEPLLKLSQPDNLNYISIHAQNEADLKLNPIKEKSVSDYLVKIPYFNGGGF